MSEEPDIQTTALGVVWRGDELLVTKLGPFEWDDETFYRPPGGGVERGESSEATVVREFAEELDAEVTVESFVGIVENRFEYAGEFQHELVFVYEVAFVDDARYDRETMRGFEDASDVTYETTWATLDDLEAREGPLYPAGLRTILETDRSRVAPDVE